MRNLKILFMSLFIIGTLAYCSEDRFQEEEENIIELNPTFLDGDFEVVTSDTLEYGICEDKTVYLFGTSAEVSLFKDESFIYVEVRGIDDWKLRFLAVYIGDECNIPIREDSIRVDISAFDYRNYFSPITAYGAFKIPINKKWGDCYSVVINEIMRKYDEQGNEIEEYSFVNADD